MRRKCSGFALAFACAFIFFALPLSAIPIVINNADFESPVTFTNSCCVPTQLWAPNNIPGWSVSNPAEASDPGGTWAPVTAFYPNGDQLFIYPLGGSQVAYSNGGVLSQTLANVTPNTEYILSVGVGLRAELVPPAYNANYTITLLAGTPGSPTTLGSWTDDSYGHNHLNPITNTPLFPLIRGGWQTIQFASQNISLAGVPLIIQLSGNSIDFDNVYLQAFQVLVPEPGTYALMGSALLTLGLILRRRKKTA